MNPPAALVRPATADEIARWDDLVLANPAGGEVLHALGYAGAKRARGWQVHHLMFDDRVAFTVIARRVFPLGQLWYVPPGPAVADAADAERFVAALRVFARARGAFLVRIDWRLPDTGETTAALTRAGLVKSIDVQGSGSTVIVPLKDDADALLAAIPSKGRYAVRRAIRDEVTAEQVEPTEANLRTMYELLKSTGESAGFPVRTWDYYSAFWRGYVAAGQGSLWFARHEDRVVAGAFVIVRGPKAYYKDGASVRDRTAYGASHLLQWRAIEHAIAQGATSYDMMGTPAAADAGDADHPMHGLGVFKTQFWPTITDFAGTWDLPIRPRAVAIWNRIGARVTAGLHRRRHGEAYY